METTVKQQMLLSGYISRMWSNLLKLGQAKITPTEIRGRLALLDDYWKRFQDGHFGLLAYEGVGTTEYASKDIFSVTEETYFQMRAKLTDTMLELERRAGTAEAGRSNRGEGSATPSVSPVVRQLQLPKIDLPKFSGDQLAWEGFRDLFRSLVHEVAEIPGVQKLQYLKSCLSGEAADLVANITLSDAAYQGAWEDLVGRYDNPRILLFAHMRNLLACPATTKAFPSELKRLLGVMTLSIRAFTALKRPVSHWDDWFVHLLVRKLDANTRLHWETSLADSRAFPSFKQLQDFLENRIRALEAAHPEAALSSASLSSPPKSGKNSRVLSNAATTGGAAKGKRCALCDGSHSLPYCAKFKALTVVQRREKVKDLGVCLNCMRAGHRAKVCPTEGRCLVCAERHHTLLHGEAQPLARTSEVGGPGSSTSKEPQIATAINSSVLTHAASADQTVILTTAQVLLRNSAGSVVKVRALLDSGSEATFISEWVAQTLKLRRNPVDLTVTGLQGTKTGAVTSSVRVAIGSTFSPELRLETDALVLRSLTNLLPSRQVTRKAWPHLRDLTLADPEYDRPARVDAILGADVYGQVLEPAICRGELGSPVAQLTAFGWMLTGTLGGERPTTTSHQISVLHAQGVDNIAQALQRFWELEEVPTAKRITPEEERAEAHFRDTHRRDHTGRYVVRLPRTTSTGVTLGASRPAALSMLLSSERRLAKQTELKRKYVDFMVEYSALRHMDTVPREARTPKDSFYLPHHAVFKTGDPNGKIRVVFNASFRTSTGHSLNDLLLPGPKLQPDLWLILTRWRVFRVGFTTDIVKMFRQIRIHPEDADLQRILWRPEPAEEIREFRLMTVTYGTASAPFLALRTLQQLALDEASRFPLGAGTLLRHTYVDDILAGADDSVQALETQRQLVGLLRSGGFALPKWASNVPSLCPAEGQDEWLLPTGDSVGALGLSWQPASDTLSLRVATIPTLATPSKRTVLSAAARLFDPLGWVAPSLIFAKVFLQDLWLAGCGWDDPLPTELAQTWTCFVESLRGLAAVRLARWVRLGTGSTQLELHGFSDASERAYAAAVYLRLRDSEGNFHSNLLVARTKVAPIRTQSVPRLELCGALLLARLLDGVARGLREQIPDLDPLSILAWTDARVVLSWIRSHASRWTPFVANRVAAIQEILPAAQWAHVGTDSNPADLATRGILPADLVRSDLWWDGPSWLRRERSEWPTVPAEESLSTQEELKRSSNHSAQATPGNELLERFSTFFRLVRVTAICFRFYHNARRRQPSRSDFLTSLELAESGRTWILLEQRRAFSEEILKLDAGRPIRARSRLRGLFPFLDSQGALRVGGRLHAAPLDYGGRHPLVLPGGSHLSCLLVRHAHAMTLHGGPRLVQSFLRRRVWILGEGSLIRREIHRCVRCARFRAELGRQQMGQLPPERLRPTRAFLCSGADFAGPIRIRATKGRGRAALKGYICLFVCLATKAVHLEAVSDLSTAAFLAAFRRFVSRRGRCAQLWSDNGTNFRGADAELRAMFRAASIFYKETGEQLANEGTAWRFIPPHAPHFGGLWEAGVKSTKHHIRRVLGDQTLTYEELATLLCQVEACLNSRPLCPTSTDPADLTALTPGHFLVGEPLINIPEAAEVPDTVRHPGTRWRMISAMRDHFWRRWSAEYLHQLQQAGKWKETRLDFQVGDLVLIKDELAPPAKWAMGRITAVHPGRDGRVRVATVRTATTELTRPIAKLCLLPVPPADRVK